MTEPTDRHRELAVAACRNWARDGALIHGEVARACAIACAEERERIATLAIEEAMKVEGDNPWDHGWCAGLEEFAAKIRGG